MIRRGYLDGRFGQLHYREAGPVHETGCRPVLLLHQNPASSLEYEPLMAALGTDRRVVALDTPGYGMSDGADRPLGLDECAACFAAALTALGLEEAGGCDVYGFHTGALLAVELALAAPATVRCLVLTGVPMRAASERAERLEQARAAPALDEGGEVALGMAQGLWEYVVRARTAGVPMDRAARQWIDKLRSLDRASWAYLGVWSYPYDARLPLVRQPTLLIQPHEALFDRSCAAVRLIGDHRIVEMPDFERDLFDLPDAIDLLTAHMRAFLDDTALSGDAE